jgi:hypothetical protein
VYKVSKEIRATKDLEDLKVFKEDKDLKVQ